MPWHIRAHLQDARAAIELLSEQPTLFVQTAASTSTTYRPKFFIAKLALFINSANLYTNTVLFIKTAMAINTAIRHPATKKHLTSY
jgi:hypothetical protein